MEFEIIFGTVLFIFSLFFIFKKQIRKFLYRLKTKLQFQSLRTAIHDADKDKGKTGRKNIVVYNTSTSNFEPVQKKQLKAIANRTKNKSNKAMTDGRKKMMKQTSRPVSMHRVKNIESKSLYVTK